MIGLPDVCLMIMETKAHELQRLTTLDFLSKVRPGEILVFTDNAIKLDVPGSRNILVPDWPTKEKYLTYWNTECIKFVSKPFVLFLEWDSGLCDPSMWSDKFYDYDFIGAPWWYTDQNGKPIENMNVGNGGFSLRSRRLMEFVANDRNAYPVLTDNNLCRDYRANIERRGRFKWAPIAVANDFAFEGFGRLGLPDNLKHFGYHHTDQWHRILDRDELRRRVQLLRANGYASHRLPNLLANSPWLKEAA